MITRKIGALLRGRATPFQLVAACVLGALLGFAPGFLQGPALVGGLVALLLVVNANLGLALLVAAGAKLASLALAPVSFRLGQWLLEGPLEGWARTVVNAPVLAWCGLEYYAVAGGQVLGLALGLGIGLGAARTVGSFRRRMLAAQDSPSRLRELAAKPGSRFLLWLFFGGKGKKSWEQKLQRRVGNPIRVWGVAMIALVVGGAWAAQATLAGPWTQRVFRSTLTRANGATADVGRVELDLKGGRFAAFELALADPEALGQDLFRAAHLEADVDGYDLARRRLHVQRIVVRDVQSGVARDTPGERVKPATPEPVEDEGPGFDPRDLSLEDVLHEVELWRDRLGQARHWLDLLAGEQEPAEEGDGEALRERLEREAQEGGWFSVRADDLVAGTPTFRLSELVVDGIAADWLGPRTFDLRAQELSSHPGLVDGAPRAELASRDGKVAFAVDLAPVSRGGGAGALSFHWHGLSVDHALAQLRLGGEAPLSGGTLDLELDGSWDAGRVGWIDLPLTVTLRNTTLTVEGIEPTPIEALVLPITLRGPIDAPRIRFDRSTFFDAVAEAGKRELANRLRAKAAEELNDLAQSLGEDLPVQLEDLGGLGQKVPGEAQKALGRLLGGKK